MTILSLFLAHWDVILVVLIVIIGIIIKLKSLWNGNIVEWLIAICNEMEEEFGAGMGLLKKTKAYAIFVDTFPIISKLISAEQFNSLVDKALMQLEEFLESKKEQ